MPEPISLEEAKVHLRAYDTSEESLISAHIVAAREWVEDYTGLILTRRQVTESLDGLAAPRLRAWPVDPATPPAIDYRDRYGADQTIVDATINAAVRPARLFPAAGDRWPICCTIDGAIAVTFTAGYASPSDIPQVLIQAMRVLLTAFYDDREAGDMTAKAEASAKRLCRRYKKHTL